MLINQMPGLALDSTTAIASDILSGKTAYDGDGNLITGTITSKSAATYAASTSNQTISSGQYLSGTQTIAKVNVPAASSILSGSSVTSNGNTLVSGSMTNRGAYTATTSYQGSVTIPAGYHNGSGYITGGSASYAGATIDASKVLNGYKGWNSSGQLITGSLQPSTVWTGLVNTSQSNRSVLTFNPGFNPSNIFAFWTSYPPVLDNSSYFDIWSTHSNNASCDAIEQYMSGWYYYYYAYLTQFTITDSTKYGLFCRADTNGSYINITWKNSSLNGAISTYDAILTKTYSSSNGVTLSLSCAESNYIYFVHHSENNPYSYYGGYRIICW